MTLLTRVKIFGGLIGLVINGLFVFTVITGELNVNMSGMSMDYTKVTYSEEPAKFIIASAILAVIVGIYWFVWATALRVIRNKSSNS